MSYKETFNKIMSSSLFRLDGEDIDLTQALTDLGNQVMEADEADWNLGELLDCSLPDLIVGAYWALTEWHGGQHSSTYAAMCSLGRVFNPGYASGPEEGTSEEYAYQVVNEYYQDLYKNV